MIKKQLLDKDELPEARAWCRENSGGYNEFKKHKKKARDNQNLHGWVK